MASHTPEERLKKLDEEREKLVARLAEKKARELALAEKKKALKAADARKLDTRRKIIIGGAVMALLRRDEGKLKSWAESTLIKVVAEKDRSVILELLTEVGKAKTQEVAGETK